MKITYANSKLEKYFNDYKSMQKKIPADWVRSVKKTMDRLVAADKFGDFLSLGLGKPEQLKGGGEQIRYSLHVTANVRLIIELNATFVKELDATARIIDAAERAITPFLIFVSRFGLRAWNDLVFNKIYTLNQMEDEFSRRAMLSLLRKLSECSSDSLKYYRDNGALIGNFLNASYFVEVNKNE